MRSLIAGIFLLIILTSCSIIMIGGYKGYQMVQIAQSLRSIQGRMAEATSGNDLRSMDAEEASLLIKEARAEAEAFQEQVEPLIFLAPLLDWTPEFGPLMGDAEHYLELTDAFTTITGILEPEVAQGLQILQSDSLSDEETLPALLTLLKDTEPKFVSIEDDILRAQLAYAAIENKEGLPQQVNQFIPLLDQYLPMADELLDLARILPDLFAMGGTRSYLVVAQNEDSLRPTGGAIRDIGVITVSDGDVTRINFESTVSLNTLGSIPSYGDSYPPFDYFLNQPELAFRDSSFWPDYAVSAENMAILYEQSYPERNPLSGVIAIDQQFMKLLVNGFGQLSVEGYGNIAGDDVLTLLRRAQDSRDRAAILSDDWWLYHESVMDELIEAAKTRLENGYYGINKTQLGSSMLQAIEEGHLQIWLTTDSEQALLRKLDWTRELISKDGSDTLYVVDTNMGQNLANLVTDRVVTYEVALDWDGSADAMLDIQYDHTALFQTSATDGVACQQQTAFATTNAVQYELLADQCYYNYLRIYTAPNSQITRGTRHAVPGEWLLRQVPWDQTASIFVDDSGLTRTENFLVVPRGESVTSQYNYSIAGPVIKKAGDGIHQYNLTVFKQAGHKPEALTVHVNLPPGSRLVQATPEPISAESNRLTFQFEQRTNIPIQVEFR